jgi:hypothetical protein
LILTRGSVPIFFEKRKEEIVFTRSKELTRYIFTKHFVRLREEHYEDKKILAINLLSKSSSSENELIDYYESLFKDFQKELHVRLN